MKNPNRLISVLSILAVIALIPAGSASPILFTGTGTNISGNPISASASFDLSTAGQLKIELANTYTTAFHIGGADVLTALYFNLGNGVALTPTSAALSPGSVMVPNTGNAANIPTSWGYLASPGLINGAQPGSMAISSSGVVPGANYDFTGVHHNGSGYLDGPAYGIIGNVNDYFTGFHPLEATALTFTFSYTGTITDITNVQFVYGTAPGEGGSDGHDHHETPDPANTLTLLGTAMLAIAALRRRFA